MAKAIVSIPPSPLHNLPAGEVVDRLGVLKAQIAEMQDREKTLREELLRRGAAEIDGAIYSATITEAIRWSLDTKAIKAELGADWYDAHCRQALVTTVAVKPRAVAVKLAA